MGEREREGGREGELQEELRELRARLKAFELGGGGGGGGGAVQTAAAPAAAPLTGNGSWETEQQVFEGEQEEEDETGTEAYAALAAVLPTHKYIKRKISPSSSSEPREVLRALNMVVAALQESGSAFSDVKHWRAKYERVAQQSAELERELRACKEALRLTEKKDAAAAADAAAAKTRQHRPEQSNNGDNNATNIALGSERTQKTGINGPSHDDVGQERPEEKKSDASVVGGGGDGMRRIGSWASAGGQSADGAAAAQSVPIYDGAQCRNAIMAAVVDENGNGEVHFEGVSVGEAAAAYVAANEANAWASHVEKEVTRSHEDFPFNIHSSASFTLYRDVDSGVGGMTPSQSAPSSTQQQQQQHHEQEPSNSRRMHRAMSSSSSTRSLVQVDDCASDRRMSIPEFNALSSSSLKLRWLTRPKVVMIIVKPDVPAVHAMLKQALLILTSRENITVYLEPREHALLAAEKAGLPLEFSDPNSPPRSRPSSPKRAGCIRTWVTDVNSVRPTFDVLKQLDLVVTFGGDGTVLWSSTLLGRGPIPPVLSFSMGSMGFLAPFTSGTCMTHEHAYIWTDICILYPRARVCVYVCV